MPEPEGPRLHWTFAAIALVAIGLLVLIPSGLCTAWAGISVVIAALSSGALFSGDAMDRLLILAIVLGVGLPFVAMGIGLVRAGLRERDER